jgi:hypothetical protein
MNSRGTLFLWLVRSQKGSNVSDRMKEELGHAVEELVALKAQLS